MENKEIMVNEEVMDAAEELVTIDSGNGLKVAAKIGLAALVGFGIYKVGKHVYAKIKAKKESKMCEDCIEDLEEDFEEVE
jgi:molybdopterin-binding protein